jgi:pimeloyl-ACP methyl ester carboxylesterase
VQNPLTSLADDVAATRRILALQDGPTVLVGHSWAGTVISEVGVDPQVSALVYVAARAPDVGEDFIALAAKFPMPPISAGLVTSGGFAQLSEEAFLRDFAGGVDSARGRALYAVQGRIADTLFASRTTAARGNSSLVGMPYPGKIEPRLPSWSASSQAVCARRRSRWRPVTCLWSLTRRRLPASS